MESRKPTDQEAARVDLGVGVCGKLVPQDPDDEPATELLKKMEDEKRRLIETSQIRGERCGNANC